MKLTFLFYALCIFSLSANRANSQTARVNLHASGMPTRDILTRIEAQTDYLFVYNHENVDLSRPCSLDATDTPVAEILKTLFEHTDVIYAVEGNNILLMKQNKPAPPDNRTITGRVTDEKGEPIIGANIVEKGTTNGTITDVNGQFTLYTTDKTVLLISYIGYISKEQLVGNRDVIDIQLREDTQALDEVVVVGYGTQKKKLVTGATVQVKGDDIQKLNTVSPVGALQSQSPGVNITKSSGQPGEGFKVSIRGLGTTGNASPLYIVDGVTVENIDDLNPADIESLDVLKDAASAAIYGARAANGVILVTTKQGKAGKPSIQYDGYFGIQNVYKQITPLNAQEYALIMSEAAANSNLQPYDFPSLVPDWDKIESGQWEGTNWLKEMINKNAPIQNHSLNITGGTEQSVYSVGASYTSQEGTIGEPAVPEYRRYTFRINTEYILIKGNSHDILKFGENLNYAYTEKNGIAIGGRDNNDVGNAIKANPFLPVYNEKGEYHYAIPWNEEEANPVGLLDYERNGNLTKNHNIKGNLYFLLKPIKDLTFRSSFGINFSSNSYRKYVPEYELSTRTYRTEDYVTQKMSSGLRWIFENTLTYDVLLRDAHKLNAMVGTSAEKSGLGESMNGSNVNSIFDDFNHAYLDNTKLIWSDKTILTGSPWKQERLLSFFGRVNYNYKETYMATLVMRADASSNFAPDKRWGYFPSVSAGWVITNESFMEKTRGWLDFLKIRASWGQNGNANITPFQYLSTIAFDAMYFPGTDKLLGTTGAYSNILPNADVTWETSEQTDLGLDARLANGRLSLAFDWYKKITKDWLVQAPILGIYGTGAPFINGGNVNNKGFEIGLSWNDETSHGFRYGASINLAHNKNEITRIANNEGIIHGPTGVLSTNTAELYRAQVGYPIGYFWGYETDGLFQNEEEVKAYKNSKGELIQPSAQPGDVRFVNQDDNNVIDEKDKVMIGDPNPDFTFGLSFHFAYKGFDFNFVSNGVLGNQIATSYRSFADRPLQNYTKEVLGRWHGEGTSNRIPRVTITSHINRQYISDLYIEDGAYWRLSNVTAGYDFKRIWKSLPLQQARLYVSAQNLFTITGYSGMDPEIGYDYGSSWASGIDLGFYPSPRTFLIGLTLKY